MRSAQCCSGESQNEKSSSEQPTLEVGRVRKDAPSNKLDADATMAGDVSNIAGTEESGVEPPEISHTIENIGSTARDVCAIERNMLSHVRLGLLLSLLSSAMLLDTRLSIRSRGHNEFSRAKVPLASLYFALALCAILAGWWAYRRALQDFLRRKAFIGFQIHEFVIGTIAVLVSTTCIYLLALES